MLQRALARIVDVVRTFCMFHWAVMVMGKSELMKLVDEANGKICSMKSGRVVTNWDRIQAELEREYVDVEHVKDLVVKLTETMSKVRKDCGRQ